jgi:hypothetical protein
MKGILLALMAAGAVTAISSGPAAAKDYRYCLQSRGIGIPGDCSYNTYAQCRASASGRNADCNINPRVAFSGQRYRGGNSRRY